MGYALRYVEPAPMSEMNTTPLIDVMLVLLIMLIITIPIQTHAVKMNMPIAPSAAPPKPPEKPAFAAELVQESGVRSQEPESGVGFQPAQEQESGDRGQETAGRRQEAGDRRQQGGFFVAH